MGNKKLVVAGLGLVILIILAGIAYKNYGDANQAKKQVDTLNAVIQTKDAEIAKLTVEIKAKQDELSVVKAELDNIKKAANEASTQINKVMEQPTAQEPQAVNK